jgi:hypothetical protein
MRTPSVEVFNRHAGSTLFSAKAVCGAYEPQVWRWLLRGQVDGETSGWNTKGWKASVCAFGF